MTCPTKTCPSIVTPIRRMQTMITNGVLTDRDLHTTNRVGSCVQYDTEAELFLVGQSASCALSDSHPVPHQNPSFDQPAETPVRFHGFKPYPFPWEKSTFHCEGSASVIGIRTTIPACTHVTATPDVIQGPLLVPPHTAQESQSQSSKLRGSALAPSRWNCTGCAWC
jgi:hypothetical protein